MPDPVDSVEELRAKTELQNSQNQKLKNIQGIVLVGILGVLLFLMFGAIANSSGEYLTKLKDIETARGLITFVVAVSVMSIALVIAVYVMASTESKDEIKERFGHAKDVLATLVGIFGTVLGFYYASQNAVTDQAVIAEFQIRSGQILGHVSGSAQPYTYTIAFPNDDVKKLQQKDAKDGWIIETAPASLKKNESIQFEIVDAKGRKLSKTLKYTPDEKSPGSAPESGSQGTTPSKPSTPGAEKPQPVTPTPATPPAPKAS